MCLSGFISLDERGKEQKKDNDALAPRGKFTSKSKTHPQACHIKTTSTTAATK
jgi:hypothetical protein